MATRSDKTLADFTAIAVSPVLIMALVGSLVFFLLEVLYKGEYSGTLQWVLFFFVFGAVLVARISMQAGIEDRAPLYGLVLAGLTWIALLRFVEYPQGSDAAQVAWAINLGLIILIWWSAHKLTWDCTMIDDEVDASGQGLLEVAGLDKAETPAPASEKPKGKKKKEKTEGGLLGWLERYRKFQDEKKKKPHSPGVWVVYFSLAALPLFGLGQSLIPVGEGSRRSYVFWLMVIYVGSGLGLLLTTSFLGLRRYLRQRKLQMPASITTAWMFLGGILIGSLLFVGAILPRPSASTPFLDLSPSQKGQEFDASGNAQVGENRGKGQGRSVGDKGKADEKGEGSRTQQKQGAKKEGSDAKGSGQSEKGDKTGEKGGSKDEKGSDEKGKSPAGPGKQKAEGSSSTGNKDKKDSSSAEKKESGSGKGGSDPSSNVTQPLSQMIESLSKVLKWIVVAVLVALVAFFLIRSGLRWLANFTAWAQRLLNAFHTWWTNLWKMLEQKSETRDETAEAEAARHRPFASFDDPFVTGASDQMKPEALLRYTFAAFEAWARDRDIPREQGETPFEFVERISNEAPALETDARRMVNLYAGIAYAGQKLDNEGLDTLREFWKMLKDVAERPLSAGTARDP